MMLQSASSEGKSPPAPPGKRGSPSASNCRAAWEDDGMCVRGLAKGRSLGLKGQTLGTKLQRSVARKWVV